MSPCLRLRVATSMLVALLSLPAAAAPSEPEPEVDETVDNELLELLDIPVVSSASQVAQQANLAPATVVVISAEEMRLLGIHNLAEAINYLGVGMTVQPPHGTGTPAGEFGARGVLISEDGGSHVLITVNGHTMNEGWGGWQMTDLGLGIPWELVDHIEFVLGPGSVLYGTNAMLGVIAITTRDPDAFEGAHVAAQGGVSMPIGENGQVVAPGDGYNMAIPARASAGYGLVLKDGGATLAAEIYDVSGPDMHYGPQREVWNVGSYVAERGTWGGIANRPVRGAGGVLGLRLGSFAADVLANVHDVKDPVAYDSDLGHPDALIRVVSTGLDVRHAADLSATTTLDSRLYGDLQTYTGTWAYPPSWCGRVTSRCLWTEYNEAQAGGIVERVTIDWKQDGRITTLAGAEARLQGVGMEAWTEDAIDPDLKPTTLQEWNELGPAFAAYLQQIWRPVDPLGLNGGLRLDSADNYEGIRLSPRGAVTLSPSRLNSTTILYAEGFRAPTAGELFYVDRGFSIPTENLTAEGVRSGEITSMQRLPGGTGLVQVGAFYSSWQDLIQYALPPQDVFDAAVADGTLPENRRREQASMYQNLNDIRAHGGFLRAQVQDRDRIVQVGGSLSLTSARAESGRDEKRVAYMPDAIANAHATWAPPGDAPAFSVLGLYNGPRDTQEALNDLFVNPLRVPPLVRMRLAAVGDIPGANGLTYELGSEHTFAKSGSYLVGQAQWSGNSWYRGELTPLERLKIHVGIRYDFRGRKSDTAVP